MITDEDVRRMAMEINTAMPNPDLLHEFLCIARAEGITEGLKVATGVAESWKGRRLEGSDPESEATKAFGRGVDIAAHYIAEAIREKINGQDAPQS
jgi:hypothetical protein